MAVKTYPKTSQERLSEHFGVNEFACPCTSCTITLVDSDLIARLEAMRAITGPLRVNSGYRCPSYQTELRLRGFEVAAGISQHELGKAADIMGVSESLGTALEKAARGAGFRAVGVGHSWVHVDLRDDKDRRWEYTKR